MNFGVKVNKSSANKNAIKLITKWITSLLLNDEVTIMVSEIECNQPDCVPLETLIVLIKEKKIDPIEATKLRLQNKQKDNKSQSIPATNNSRWIGKILKPVIEVIESDIKDCDIPLNEWSTITHISKTTTSTTILSSSTVKWINNIDNELKNNINNLSFNEKQEVFSHFEKLFKDLNEDIIKEKNDEKERNEELITKEVLKEPVKMVQMKSNSNNTPLLQTSYKNLKPISNSNQQTQKIEYSLQPEIPSANQPKKKIITKIIDNNSLSEPISRHDKGGIRPRGCPW
jgi:hypothetical protein